MSDIILIIGAPRSGTTLLSGLITGNTECYPNLPECTFITQIIQHYYNIVHYSDKERFRVYANSEQELKKTYIANVANMISIVLNQFKDHTYKHLIFKDPELTSYIDLIPDFFGNSSKIVYIIRDPREVVASMLTVMLKKQRQDSYLELIFPFIKRLRNDELTKIITDQIFNYYFIAHTSKIYKNQKLCIVRYENIIKKEETEFLKLEDFLGYKIGRKAFERNYFSFDKDDPTFSKNYGKDIIEVKSDFRDKLSKKSIKLIEETFSGYNTRYKWW